jgi:hypothetical protein
VGGRGGLDDDRATISVLANAIHARLIPSCVVADKSLLDRHRDRASMLLDELRRIGSSSEEDDDARKEEEDADGRKVAATVLEMTDDSLLIPLDMVPKALGRNRWGGRTLRWSTFLGNELVIASKMDEAAATGSNGPCPCAIPDAWRIRPSRPSRRTWWILAAGGFGCWGGERRRRHPRSRCLFCDFSEGVLFFSTWRCLSFLSLSSPKNKQQDSAFPTLSGPVRLPHRDRRPHIPPS